MCRGACSVEDALTYWHIENQLLHDNATYTKLQLYLKEKFNNTVQIPVCKTALIKIKDF